MKFQLWTRDEYGTGAIVGTFSNPEEAVTKAKKLVTEANFGNSLSSSEQIKSVEAYFIEFTGKNDKCVYSGLAQNKHVFFEESSISPKFSLFPIVDITDFPVNVYIGSKFVKNKASGGFDETSFYMKDDKGSLIKNLSHNLLKNKTVYFIRPIA